MGKAPEEGEIWEWRSFGRPSEATIEIVQSRPIRSGVKDIQGEDLYLISPVSDQNVKLRRSGGGGEWVLKFKLLLTTGAQGVELYSETGGWVYKFPVGRKLLVQAARLLGAQLTEEGESGTHFTADEFIQTLALANPPVRQVKISKVRSQFDFNDGWVELSQISFPGSSTQSLSIHSPKREVVERIRDLLTPGDELEVMNYVEACRRILSG